MKDIPWIASKRFDFGPRGGVLKCWGKPIEPERAPKVGTLVMPGKRPMKEILPQQSPLSHTTPVEFRGTVLSVSG